MKQRFLLCRQWRSMEIMKLPYRFLHMRSPFQCTSSNSNQSVRRPASESVVTRMSNCRLSDTFLMNTFLMTIYLQTDLDEEMDIEATEDILLQNVSINSNFNRQQNNFFLQPHSRRMGTQNASKRAAILPQPLLLSSVSLPHGGEPARFTRGGERRAIYRHHRGSRRRC